MPLERHDHNSAFTLAIMTGSIDIVKIFLNNPKVGPNALCNGRTPLMAAIEAGNFDVFSEILKRSSLPKPTPANPVIQNELAVAIVAATKKPPGKYDNRIIDALLKHPGINPNEGARPHRGAYPSALALAIYACRLDLVRLLLSSERVDPNIQDVDGYTALGRAIRLKRADIVEILLSSQSGQKVDPMAPTLIDPGGEVMSPLVAAVMKRDIKLIRLLLSHSDPACPDIELENQDPRKIPEKRALVLAVELAANQDGYNLDIIKELLNHPGIDPNALKGDGQTALGVAIWLRKPDLVQLLLDNEKVDPNAPTRGVPPLTWAVGLGDTDITQALLADRRTDPNKLSGNDESALTACCRNDEANHHQVEIFQMLLEDPRIDLYRKNKKRESVFDIVLLNEAHREAFVAMLLGALKARLGVLALQEEITENELAAWPREMEKIGEALRVFRSNAAKLDRAVMAQLVEVEEIFNKQSPEIKARAERAAETQQEPQTEDEPRGPRP